MEDGGRNTRKIYSASPTFFITKELKTFKENFDRMNLSKPQVLLFPVRLSPHLARYVEKAAMKLDLTAIRVKLGDKEMTAVYNKEMIGDILDYTHGGGDHDQSTKQDEPDQKEGEPDEKVGEADEKVGEPDEKVGEPDEKVGEPNEKVGEPDEKVGEPDEKVGDADEKVGEPDEKVGEPDEKVGEPDEKVGDADEKVGEPDEKVGEPDETVGEADEKVGEPNEKVGEPDEKVGEPDEKVGELDEEEECEPKGEVELDKGSDSYGKSDLEEEVRDEGNGNKESGVVPKSEDNIATMVSREKRIFQVKIEQGDDFNHAVDHFLKSLITNLPFLKTEYIDFCKELVARTAYLASESGVLPSHNITLLGGRKLMIGPVISEATTSEVSITEVSATEASTGEASTNQEAASVSKTPEKKYKSDAATSEASPSESSTSEASTSEASTSEPSTNQEAASVSKIPSKKSKARLPKRKGDKLTETGTQGDATSPDASQGSNDDYDVPDITKVMGHVIELYDFPSEFTADAFLDIYKKEPRYIKWCDATHVLLVTGSVKQANKFLLIKHEQVKSRPITLASALAVKAAETLPPAGKVKSKKSSAGRVKSKKSSK